MRNFITAIVFSFLLVSVSSHAGEGKADRKMIEVTAELGWAEVSRGDSESWDTELAGAGVTGATARFDLWIVSGQVGVEFLASPGNPAEVDLSADGRLFFLRFHDFLLRAGGIDGNLLRVMVGPQLALKFPFVEGSLTVSGGVTYMNWTRPDEESQDLAGLYTGATLLLKVWRFTNELRVAYYWAPEVNFSFDGIASGEITGINDVFPSFNSGIVGSNRLYASVLRLPMVDLGPELRASINQLPDGTEFRGIAGVSGTFGF